MPQTKEQIVLYTIQTDFRGGPSIHWETFEVKPSTFRRVTGSYLPFGDVVQKGAVDTTQHQECRHPVATSRDKAIDLFCASENDKITKLQEQIRHKQARISQALALR